MASVIDLNLKPEAKTLRQFGWIALVGFGFVAALAWYEKLIFSFGLGDARPIVAGGFAALAGISAFFSLVYPKANWPIYVGLAILTFPIGFVLSYLIMATLFYLIITPVGLLLRLTKTDPMNRKLLPEAETYWVDAGPPRPSESYFKQF